MTEERAGRAARHRDFYRELDRLLTLIDHEEALEPMLTRILESLHDGFEDQVGISSGRLYRTEGGEYTIVRSFGAKGKELLGVSIPADYPPLRFLHPDRVTYFDPDDGRVDPEVEGQLGVGQFAAFSVGSEHRYVVAFGIEPDADPEEVRLALGTLRYGIQHRLRQIGWEGQLKEARGIQVSLLPKGHPNFEGYEIAGRSIPAEEVGGDVFDFIHLDPHLLGIAVGDASGHGLPAALQARDVITGLRMGVQKDLKITAVLAKLNRVIHQSGLTSRFVSLLYGELESSGNFVYVNAGHEPGFVLRSDGRVEELRSTGLVMGPVEHVDYRRNLVFLDPGDSILFYTDGVVERIRGSEEYGRDRLLEEAKARAADTPVTELPAAILEAAFQWGDKVPWADDATVVFVRRNPE